MRKIRFIIVDKRPKVLLGEKESEDNKQEDEHELSYMSNGYSKPKRKTETIPTEETEHTIKPPKEAKPKEK